MRCHGGLWASKPKSCRRDSPSLLQCAVWLGARFPKPQLRLEAPATRSFNPVAAGKALPPNPTLTGSPATYAASDGVGNMDRYGEYN